MGDAPASDARTQGPLHWELMGAQGLLHLTLRGTTDFGGLLGPRAKQVGGGQRSGMAPSGGGQSCPRGWDADMGEPLSSALRPPRAGRQVEGQMKPPPRIISLRSHLPRQSCPGGLPPPPSSAPGPPLEGELLPLEAPGFIAVSPARCPTRGAGALQGRVRGSGEEEVRRLQLG